MLTAASGWVGLGTYAVHGRDAHLRRAPRAEVNFSEEEWRGKGEAVTQQPLAVGGTRPGEERGRGVLRCVSV